jgi:hypothetical protein
MLVSKLGRGRWNLLKKRKDGENNGRKRETSDALDALVVSLGGCTLAR